MSQYNVNNIMVSSLLSSIRDGTIAIPEIQRPFVWDPTKVRDLIDSLYKGYPVGYIIVWQNPDVKLKDGTVSSGKKIIIDGQQRITALTAAIVGLEVVGADYKKKRVKIAFNPKEERFETCNPAIEKDIQWISDISTVLQPGFDAFSFVNEYCDKNKITDNAEKSSINKVINTLSQIQNNSLGVIDLSSGLDIDSVTDIFIRINSKGKKFKPIIISEEGLELIEWLSVDCTATEGEWNSDSEIKIDKLGFVIKNGQKTKEFWDGAIKSEKKPLRLKIRNICGDETVRKVE